MGSYYLTTHLAKRAGAGHLLNMVVSQNRSRALLYKPQSQGLQIPL